MRIVFVLGTGLVLGYALHAKKDQPIEAIANDVSTLAAKSFKIVRGWLPASK